LLASRLLAAVERHLKLPVPDQKAMESLAV
jgi:hypothetical protein